MNEKKYPYFGIPPTRPPRPAADEPALRGKRVILSMPDGFVYDMRACSGLYRNAGGHEVVDIASEEDWYRWMFQRVKPHRSVFPIELVWVE